MPVIDPRRVNYVRVEPRDSDRVFVDVTAYNSKNYYILGDVAVTGRLPITGNETVLDAINFANGLMPTAAPAEHPSGPAGSSGCVLRADSAGQPGRNHQRRRPHDQLPAHARRSNRRLSRPDRQVHGLPRPTGRSVPDRHRLDVADRLHDPCRQVRGPTRERRAERRSCRSGSRADHQPAARAWGEVIRCCRAVRGNFRGDRLNCTDRLRHGRLLAMRLREDRPYRRCAASIAELAVEPWWTPSPNYG